jgi:Sec-independent protein translocase protein TatA
VELLGVGPLEVALIILLAIVLFGPKDIARTARSAGRFLNRIYHSEGWRTLLRTSETLRTLPNRLAREAELEELDTLRRTMSETKRSLTEGARPDPGGLRAWTPSSGTAPPATPGEPSVPPPASGAPADDNDPN